MTVGRNSALTKNAKGSCPFDGIAFVEPHLQRHSVEVMPLDAFSIARNIFENLDGRARLHHLTRQSSAAGNEGVAGKLWKYFNHEMRGNKPARRRLQRFG